MTCERSARRRSWARAAVVLVSLLGLASRSPRPAHAAPAAALESAAVAPTERDRAEALRLLREGNRLFDEGSYQEALTRYQEAHARVHSTKLLFNLAQAYRMLERPVEALDLYERFLVEVPDAAPALRAEAERQRANLEQRVAMLDVTAEGDRGDVIVGARVSVDGADEGVTPLGRPVRVTLGPHQIVVEPSDAAAAPFIARVDVSAGQRLVVTARLAPAPTAPAPVSAIEPPRAALTRSPTTAKVVVAAPAATTSGGAAPRLGLMARADLDWRLTGTGVAAAITSRVGAHTEIAVGGFWWPVQGAPVGGASLGGSVYLARPPFRPLISADAQLYVQGGAHWAARAAGGLMWDLDEHLGLFATAGIEHTSRRLVVNGAQTAETFFVPAVGVQGRL